MYNLHKSVHACMLSHFSRVQLFVTLWMVAHQAPLSMGFSRQEDWSGLHALLQGIFQPRDRTHICLYLLHRRRIPYVLSHLGNPYVCIHTTHTHTHTHTHIFSIHSSASGHLDCFHTLTIINIASVNI